MAYLKACEQGKQKILQARNEIGWAVEDAKWLIEASKILAPERNWENSDYYADGVSAGTWNAFLYNTRKKGINTTVFKAYCQVLGLSWEEVRQKEKVNELAKTQSTEQNLFQPKNLLGKLHGDIPYRREMTSVLPRDELNELKTLVLAGKNQPIVVIGAAYRVGVLGMGGIGKSFLVSMLAQDKEVQCAFPDGVFWITLGQNPDLKLRQRDLVKMLGDNSPVFQDLQQSKVYLSELLKDKNCLLIIDDVWNSSHAEPFDVLCSPSRMVITSRDSKLINDFNAQPFEIKLLSEQQAIALLALRSGQHEENLPDEAYEVARECGYLPLALAMVGSMVRGKPNRWENILYKLRNADLEKITAKFPDYEHPNLLKAIQVSVEALEIHIQLRYFDFAVFAEDTPIPEATLQLFWESEGLDEYDTQDTLDLLESRSLLQKDEQGRYTLHDLQYDYVCKQLDNLRTLHNRLLNGYAKQCTNGWHTGKNDGYFFENLVYHLDQAGRNEELYKLLTASPEWMESKFIACHGDNAYISDLDLVIAKFNYPLEANELLILFQLYTARQIVNYRVSSYEDVDLEILVLLGRKVEAINHARMRNSYQAKFNGLIAIHEALYINKQWDLALLDEAMANLDKIDSDWLYINALCKIAVAFTQAGSTHKGEKIFYKAEEKIEAIEYLAEKSEALSELAIALGKIGLFERSQETIRKIRSDWQRSNALAELGLFLTQAKKLSEAEQAFDEAFKAAENELILNENDEPLDYLCSKKAISLCCLGKVDDAIHLIEDMRETTIKPEAMRELIVVSFLYDYLKEGEIAITKMKNFISELDLRIIAGFKNWNYMLLTSLKQFAVALAVSGYKEKSSLIFAQVHSKNMDIPIPSEKMIKDLGLLSASLMKENYQALGKKILFKGEDIAKQTDDKLDLLCYLAESMLDVDEVKEANRLFNLFLKNF